MTEYHARIPVYCIPRIKWRKSIWKALTKKPKYSEGDRIELIIKLYMSKDQLALHDVDNRLKDIMDTLRGRFGGPKKKRNKGLISNDKQIYKVTIEKCLPPKQSHGAGHLRIKILKGKQKN